MINLGERRMIKVICVTSGGGDSIANGLMMLTQGNEVIFLHIPHGQKCAIGEKLACQAIVDELKRKHYPCSLQIVEFPWLGEIGGSGLTDKEIPVPDGLEGVYGSTITKIFTPNRNSILLGIAGALAEREKAEYVTFGANRAEEAYPDNTKDYLDTYTEVLKYSCYHIHPKVISPEWEMDKVEIYRWIIDNGFDWVLSKSWSCDNYPHYLVSQPTKREHILPDGYCGCCRNKQISHFILREMYGEKYSDTMVYANSHWFGETFLPTIKVKGIPKRKWFSKYANILGCEVIE